MSIAALLGAPMARGLFQRAITQSGAANVHLSADAAAAVTAEYCARANVREPADLLELPVERLLATQAAMAAATYVDFDASVSSDRPGGLSFSPVVDGVILSRTPEEAIAAGAAAEVTLLAGSTAEEWRLFQAFGTPPTDDADLLKVLARLLPQQDPVTVLGLYKAQYPLLGHKDLKAAVMTDQFFTGPTRRLAQAQSAHAQDTRVYRFNWPSPAMGGIFGSCHALDLPFMWGTYDLAGLVMFVGSNPPPGLSTTMMDAWLQFARSGDPRHERAADWPAYSPAEPAVFDFGETSQPLADPLPATLALWV